MCFQNERGEELSLVCFKAWHGLCVLKAQTSIRFPVVFAALLRSGSLQPRSGRGYESYEIWHIFFYAVLCHFFSHLVDFFWFLFFLLGFCSHLACFVCNLWFCLVHILSTFSSKPTLLPYLFLKLFSFSFDFPVFLLEFHPFAFPLGTHDWPQVCGSHRLNMVFSFETPTFPLRLRICRYHSSRAAHVQTIGGSLISWVPVSLTTF